MIKSVNCYFLKYLHDRSKQMSLEEKKFQEKFFYNFFLISIRPLEKLCKPSLQIWEKCLIPIYVLYKFMSFTNLCLIPIFYELFKPECCVLPNFWFFSFVHISNFSKTTACYKNHLQILLKLTHVHVSIRVVSQLFVRK